MSRAGLYAAVLVGLVIGVPLAAGATPDQPPPPSIDLAPPNPSGTSSAIFTFSHSDPTALFQCQLDAGGFSPCSSPIIYQNLGDGSHTFEVKADSGGEESEVSSYTWTIDTVAPPAPAIDSKPADPSNSSSPSFAFSDSDLTALFQCQLDAGGFSSCSSPTFYPSVADGSHAFDVRAFDLAGNVSQVSSYSWRTDTVAPETAIASGPGPVSSSASATFSFTGSEPGLAFMCSLDGGGVAPCTSPQRYAGLADGTHVFKVQALDAAGNADPTPASYSWQVATTVPTLVDHTPPGNVSGLKRSVGYGVLRLVWKRPRDVDFDHVNVFVSTSSKGRPRTLVYTGQRTTYVNKRFRNGTYYRYAIISYDNVGNASRGVAVVVPASFLLISPRDGAVVHAPPRLLWRDVVKASFYNVQLYYDGRKILSAWPSASELKLGRSWTYGGGRYTLKKGRYTWYVWPGFGRRSQARYGQLVGQGTFRVS